MLVLPAIITFQPTEPSCRAISSVTRTAVSSDTSPPLKLRGVHRLKNP